MTFSENGTAVLVDHNAFHRKLLRSVLRSVGFYDISEHDEVTGGLKQVIRTHPDFMFIDFDTAKRSETKLQLTSLPNRSVEAQPYLFILMANPTIRRVDKAISYGADWIICRPFSQLILTRRLHAILNPNPLIRPVSKESLDLLSPTIAADQYATSVKPEANCNEPAYLSEETHNHLWQDQKMTAQPYERSSPSSFAQPRRFAQP